MDFLYDDEQDALREAVKGLMGKAIEVLLPVLGARMIKSQTAQVLERVSG